MRTLLTFLTVIAAQVIFAQSQPLFSIIEDGRIGYINTSGQTVIPPIFFNGNNFSDGLAAVRQNGYYGFINEKGVFVINPEYDFVTDFIYGLAAVYKNGKFTYINKDGKKAIPEVYKSMTLIDSQKAIVRTYTRKQGVIDLASKQLLVDTAFGLITMYGCGAAIVEEYKPGAKYNDHLRVGVVDAAGKLIVPLGRYQEIKPFAGKYAVVKIREHRKREEGIDGVIDEKGRLLFKRPYKNGACIESNYHEGLAIVNLYRKKRRSVPGLEYQGFIDLNGVVVLNDTNYLSAGVFSNGRAFMQLEDDKYIMIDRGFKRVGKESYEECQTFKFSNGATIVNMPDGYAIIDTAGNFRSRYRYYEVDEVGIVDGYFFFAAEKADGAKLFGIADVDGNEICKPVIEVYDNKGFKNGLLRASIDGRMAYINKKGNIVWQQRKDPSLKLQYLNIDYMNRGYFYAYSSMGDPETGHSGGWALSSNTPKKIKGSVFPAIQPEITIDTTVVDTFAAKYYGYTLLVSNSTRDTIQFHAQDSRLYVKLQAQDSKGEWKDIEYLPNSWCGNSYHTIDLEPGAYWRFTIPNYQGEIKTRIRAELKYIDRYDRKNDRTVYSNIINGSVNPAQFWNKRRYSPENFMDPYFE